MSGDDSCGHSHAHHDISDTDKGAQFSLYLKIDKERLVCLNESVAGSGKTVFKPWEERLTTSSVKVFDIYINSFLGRKSIIYKPHLIVC